MTDLNPTGTCVNCNKRPAAVWWCDGAMDFIHFGGLAWCDYCTVEAQLKHARERAAAIPDLEKRLADLTPNTLAGEEWLPEDDMEDE
jgi:hypothetical protein